MQRIHHLAYVPGMDPRRAVVLLSGGMDSATCLAIAQSEGFDCYALSFRYGQRHSGEVEAARKVALSLGVTQQRVVDLDPASFGGSALTSDLPVPKNHRLDQIGIDIPTTYVPARNLIFLSWAMAYAEVLEARDVFIGVNSVDYSGYPDCRPEFIAAFQATARLGTRLTDLTVHIPLATLSKAEIITRGIALGVDFSLTRTCYDPDPSGAACGHCDACILRLRGFAEAGLNDPAPYQAGKR